jgi:NAD(P)-dependent dehydrogenase (short-subunit alcohol dehydrogenase family)
MKHVVLITGVEGGIGNAAAQLFTKKGWVVFGVDIKPLSKTTGVAQFVQADISQPESWEIICKRIIEYGGQLNALINNAAIQICKPLIETSIAEWDATMATNVRSVFLGSRSTYPLLHQYGGSIVNISSVHSVATSSGLSAYVASKGAITSLTRAMALEFGPEIRVNAVLPGAISTAMLYSGLCRNQVPRDNLNTGVQELGEKHAIGRIGQPDEVAQVIYFLSDNEQSAFMTGQSVIIDGGATARLSTE